MRVGYQGIEGAYSEAALYKHFGKDVIAISFETFDEVFEAVKKNDVDFGFLPFENSIAGSVVMNSDLMLKGSMYIIGEAFLKISHCLLSQKGNKLENIKKVYSHPHAIHQCHKFLEEHKIKSVLEYDTAGSAKIVKERNKIEEAAIASELCAEIYGLDVLEKNIESDSNNTTRFLILVNKDKVPDGLKKEKTSIAFKAKHYPGALVNCLQRLSKHSINMTKLESRPILENPGEYVFYVDFEGSVDDDNVKLALSEMEAMSIFVKILGSYPKGTVLSESQTKNI
jgi:prephenate dehydratase|tara:strand:+ start:1782 stop:2630 length:849 start_codon:yes stop_codon:yes gene_type:complete